MKRMRKCRGGYIRLTVIDNIIQKMKVGGMSPKSRRKNHPCLANLFHLQTAIDHCIVRCQYGHLGKPVRAAGLL